MKKILLLMALFMSLTLGAKNVPEKQTIVFPTDTIENVNPIMQFEINGPMVVKLIETQEPGRRFETSLPLIYKNGKIVLESNNNQTDLVKLYINKRWPIKLIATEDVQLNAKVIKSENQ